MKTTSSSYISSFIWSVSALLRGDFKQSQYRNIILPFTLLRRLECVFEKHSNEFKVEFEKVKGLGLSDDESEKLLLKKLGLPFYNVSPVKLSNINPNNIKQDLTHYISSFSNDVRELFEQFQINQTIENLFDSQLLYGVINKFCELDLNPDIISDTEMGQAFEELIRLLAENSSESMGEHFTPRDIVKLTTSLIFIEDQEVLSQNGITRSIYDPTLGTGGFLSSAVDYIDSINPKVSINIFGQELNSESYVISKAIALIRGQNSDGIKLGDTLASDKLMANKFDYVLSNPPFGMSWQKIQNFINQEYTFDGIKGRFGAGLPRISDATLLFVLHAISKLKTIDEGGGRIGVIVNSSCLFTGDAGSGESEIRRFLLENDLLESIIALPQNMFFNTSVQPYILILSNRKTDSRKDKVQLINARELGLRLRKNIGSKTTELDQSAIDEILNIYSQNIVCLNSKVIDKKDFYYRKIKVKLNAKVYEYEKMPFNSNVDTYFEEELAEIYKGFAIDETYIDKVDNNIGIVGAELSFSAFDDHSELKGKQFRQYFKENGDDWDLAISKTWRKVILKGRETYTDDDLKSYYRFSINEEFDNDYLRYFFSSDKWKQWLITYMSTGAINAPNKHNTLRKKIDFPDIHEQREIASILDETTKWQNKLTIIEADIWRDSETNYALEKFKLPVDKELDSRLIEIAPYPFANIMHHYDSIKESDYKVRYELLLKLFECLAVFSVSVLLGHVEIKENKGAVIELFKKQKNFLKNATFGTWVKLNSLIKEKHSDDSIESLIVETLYSDKLNNLFEESLSLRNETSGHGSYPTKSAARDTFTKVEKIYYEFMSTFYSIFEKYSLVRPINSVWNEEHHIYELDDYSGLGCYPFGSKSILTSLPLVNEELYIVADKSSDDKIKLFPFVCLIDIEKDSGLEAFYFYSRIAEDTEGKQSTDNGFTFISHQQINKQKQIHTNKTLLSIFNDKQ
jgi:type I restriction-modification system DNA methylase subunit